jgi:hypothetical protein
VPHRRYYNCPIRRACLRVRRRQYTTAWPRRGTTRNGCSLWKDRYSAGRAELRGGELALTHRQRHGSSTFNKRTCLATVTSSGTYRITGGTGRYRHVSGNGDYRLTAYALVAKVHGKCAANVVPYAQETLLTASGPIQR